MNRFKSNKDPNESKNNKDKEENEFKEANVWFTR